MLNPNHKFFFCLMIFGILLANVRRKPTGRCDRTSLSVVKELAPGNNPIKKLWSLESLLYA